VGLQSAAWEQYPVFAAAFSEPNEVRVFKAGVNVVKIADLRTEGVPLIALSADGRLAIAEEAGDTKTVLVSIFDLRSGSAQPQTSSIPLPIGGQVVAVTFTDKGNAALVVVGKEIWNSPYRVNFRECGDLAFTAMPGVFSSQPVVALADGGSIIAVSDGEHVILWKPRSLVTTTFELPNVSYLAINPSANLVAVGVEWSQVVRVLDLDSEVVRTWQVTVGQVGSLAFSGSGSVLAVDDTKAGVIELVSVTDGSSLASLAYGYTRGRSFVALSSDGGWVVAGGDDHQISFWRGE
jgi:hypothetical protein